MRYGLLFGCVGLALACGDDDAVPEVDAGADAGIPPCAMVDGRGTGSSFRTIDDAVAAGAVRICLGEGDFEPPTVALQGSLIVEGLGAERSAIEGALGCRSVASHPPAQPDTAPTGATVVLEIASGSRVELRDLTLRGCQLGVLASDADVVLRSVTIDRVYAGVFIDGAAGRAEVADSELRPLTSESTAGALGFLPAGMLITGSATGAISASVIDGQRLSVGVQGFGSAAVELTEVSIQGGIWGFFIDQLATGQTTILDTTIRGLVGAPPSTAVNLITGGTVTIDGLTIEDSDSHGLVLDEVAMAEVEGFVVRRIAAAGLQVRGGAARLGDASFNEMGFAAISVVGTSADFPTLRAGSLELTGGVGSASSEVHLIVDGDAAVSLGEAGSLMMDGGGAGVLVLDGASVTLSPNVRVTAARYGYLVDDGGTLMLGGATTLATDVALAALGGTATGTLDVRGGGTGVFVDGGEARLTGGSVEGTREHGAVARAGVLDLDGTTLRDCGQNAVIIEGGAHAVLTDVTIDAAGGRGVEVRDAEATIAGGTVRGTLGAAIAFYGGVGSVSGVAFGGATLVDGRADEVLITDVGTGVGVTVESNQFDLNDARDCSAGGCTLVLLSGPSAVGIVRPNCLRASTETAAVRTVVDQDGADLQLEGDATWSTLLAGSASDLGLTTGTAGAPLPPQLAPTIDPGLYADFSR